MSGFLVGLGSGLLVAKQSAKTPAKGVGPAPSWDRAVSGVLTSRAKRTLTSRRWTLRLVGEHSNTGSISQGSGKAPPVPPTSPSKAKERRWD